MDYNRSKFVLLYFINILVVSFSEDQTDMFNLKNRKRIALRSSDPLTRRSAGEKHFIRFGRSDIQGMRHSYTFQSNDDYSKNYDVKNQKGNLRKREIRGEPKTDIAVASKSFLGEERSATIPSQDTLCWLPKRAYVRFIDLRFNCYTFQKLNFTTSPFQVVSKNFNIDDENNRYDNHADDAFVDRAGMDQFGKGGINVSNKHKTIPSTRKLLHLKKNERYVFHHRSETRSKTNSDINESPPGESTPLKITISKPNDVALDYPTVADDTYVRASRSKFGRNLFSRYDRGRDNFMRLGRSNQRFENRVDKRYQVVMNKFGLAVPSGVMRNELPLESNAFLYPRRMLRRFDSFIRLGRKYEFEPFFKKHDSNFMRLGRRETLNDNLRLPRKHDAFIRYGKRDPNNVRSNGRLTRKHDNFMRLGRAFSRCTKYHRLKMKLFGTIGDWCMSSINKRDKARNFVGLVRLCSQCQLKHSNSLNTIRTANYYYYGDKKNYQPRFLRLQNLVRISSTSTSKSKLNENNGNVLGLLTKPDRRISNTDKNSLQTPEELIKQYIIFPKKYYARIRPYSRILRDAVRECGTNTERDEEADNSNNITPQRLYEAAQMHKFNSHLRNKISGHLFSYNNNRPTFKLFFSHANEKQRL